VARAGFGTGELVRYVRLVITCELHAAHCLIGSNPRWCANRAFGDAALGALRGAILGAAQRPQAPLSAVSLEPKAERWSGGWCALARQASGRFRGAILARPAAPAVLPQV
jgi:hypothetical protein